MDKTKIRTPKQKSRLHCRQLYNSIYQYRNIDGIQLIDMFMHKPSKRDYPDYYDVSTIVKLNILPSFPAKFLLDQSLFCSYTSVHYFSNISGYCESNGHANN